MKKIAALIMCFSIFSSLYSYEIKDGYLYDIYKNKIKVKKYNKIIVIDPAVVELIFLLNGEKSIAGIGKNEKSKIWPYEETEKLTSIGSASKPSFEKVIALEPDLVILNGGSMGMTAGLKALEIPFVFHDSSKSIEKILESINIYGVLLDKNEEAKELYEKSMGILERIKIEEKENPLKLKGVLIYSASPIISYSNNYLPGKALTYMGIENIAGNAAGNMPILSSELILEKDIDIIIMSKNIGKIEDFLMINPILEKTRVVKNGNIILFNTIDFLRGSPKLFETMEVLYNQLKEIKNKSCQEAAFNILK